MKFFALLILLSVSSAVELVDEVYQVPANDWRYVDLNLKQRAAIVKASINVQTGPGVRLMLLRRRDLERMSHGESYAAVRALPASRTGGFEWRAPASDDYVVALENRGAAAAASVHLRILLDFGDATQLSPERRLVVIAISFAVFAGIAGFSAVKLWRAANPRAPEGSGGARPAN